MSRFEEKVAVVTGGAGSIGFEVARGLAEEGASVLLVDVDEEALQKRAEGADAEGLPISYVVADVAEAEGVQRYVQTAVERYGKIDFFFNNAGVEGAVHPLTEYPEDAFDTIMDVNVKGAFLGMKYVAPEMNEGGSIVITSSVAGLQGSPGLVGYHTSKHAVVGIMRTAALEFAERDIRVNSVHPGPVDNRMMRSLESGMNPDDSEAVKERLGAAVPMGRYARPDEVRDAVLYLFSDQSSYVHGTTFVVDGGMGA